jgi:predicted RNA-binding protein with PUA-like domain
MAKGYWLVKQEPKEYPWRELVREGGCSWEGVRNYQARNQLRSMRAGDLVLYYHSVQGKEVVGIAKVKREAYPDPTAERGDWSAVDLIPVKTIAKPVSLADIKADPVLFRMPLIRQSRLSVMPVTAEQFRRVLELGETNV